MTLKAFARRVHLPLAAFLIGVAAAFVRLELVGFLAARHWPSWFAPWAHGHKYLAVQVWWVAMSLLPSALVALAFGAILTMLWRRTSVATVLVAASSWFAYDLVVGFIAYEQSCLRPWRCFLDPFRIDPLTSTLGVLVPMATLLGYVWVRNARMAGSDLVS